MDTRQDLHNGYRKVRLVDRGREGQQVFVDGVEQSCVTGVDVHISPQGLHTVTMTFDAHVTMETKHETERVPHAE